MRFENVIHLIFKVICDLMICIVHYIYALYDGIVEVIFDMMICFVE